MSSAGWWTLRMLGGLALDAPAGTSVRRAGQRRRLALLAVLARAPDGCASRDRLVGLLWPEAANANARASLSSALYDLRGALGDDAILRSGEDVRLTAGSLRSDVVELETALDCGDAETALALYRGPFLDGIHIADAWAFDAWVEEERQRIRDLLMAGVAAEAERRLASGDAAGAVSILKRISALEPLRTELALRHARALEATGDRAAALAVLAEHTHHLRCELDLEPGPEILELERRIRHAPAGPVPAGRARSSEAPSPGRTTGHEEVAPAEHPRVTATAAPAPPLPPAAQRGGFARRRPRRWSLASVLLLLLLALGASWLLVHLLRTDDAAESTAAAPRDALRLAVLPFHVQGAGESEALRRGAVSLLSAGLDGIGPVRTVNPAVVLAWSDSTADPAPLGAATTGSVAEAASSLGADLVVTGWLWVSSDRIRLLAVLHEPSGQRRAEAAAEGSADRFPELLDHLGVELVGKALSDVMPELGLAAGQTTSLSALRRWLEGERLFRTGRFLDAEEAFSAAIQEDSAFVLAHYRLALATLWADRPGVTPAESERTALEQAARLPTRERRLVEAYAAWRRGDADRAESLYRRVLSAGDDAEAWFQLGETLFHYNPVRGRPAAESREPFQRVLDADPDHWGALWHIAQLDALEGRIEGFFQGVDQLLDRDPDSDRALELNLLRTLDRSAAAAAAPPVDGVERVRLVGAAWRAAVHLNEPHAARRFLEPLTYRSAANDRATGELLTGWMDLAAGRPEDAREAASRVRAAAGKGWFTWAGAELEAYSYLPPFAPPSPETVARLVHELDSLAMDPHVNELNAARFPALLAGILEGVGGGLEGNRLQARLQRIEDRADHDDADARPAVYALRAWLAWLHGDVDQAIRDLRQSREHVWFGDLVATASPGSAFQRFLLAEALLAAGRPEEALRWYRSHSENALPDLAWRAPGLFRIRQILMAMGREAEAEEALQLADAAWVDADPSLRDRTNLVMTSTTWWRHAPRGPVVP